MAAVEAHATPAGRASRPRNCEQNRVIAKQVKEVTKLRLIHDLKRSGVNQRVVVSERVILPRHAVLVEDSLTPHKECRADGWETLITVFADAIKQYHGSDREQASLGGQTLGG